MMPVGSEKSAPRTTGGADAVHEMPHTRSAEVIRNGGHPVEREVHRRGALEKATVAHTMPTTKATIEFQFTPVLPTK